MFLEEIIFWYRSPLRKWGWTQSIFEIIKFGGSLWNEINIFSLLRFNVTITGAINAFVLISDLNVSVNNWLYRVRTLDSSSLASVIRSSNWSGTISRESSRRLKALLLVAAANVSFYFYSLFCANAPLSYTDYNLEASALKERTMEQRPNNESRKNTLPFRVSVIGSFKLRWTRIALTTIFEVVSKMFLAPTIYNIAVWTNLSRHCKVPSS